MLTTQITSQLTPQQLWRQKTTRSNSIVKTIRVPESLYCALKDWSRDAGCSINALVRKALSTRFHNPNIPTPNGCATRYLHIRVLHQEWAFLKDYARAWKMPLWKALFLLLSRPYCITDRPRATSVLHDVLHNYRRKEKEEKNMNECTFVTQNQNDVDNPALKGLVDIGVTYRVASDLAQRYDHELLLFVTDKVSRNSNIRFPAAFAVWWLGTGLAQWHYERELARKERQREKANEPLAPYHRKWSEMKQELGVTPVVDPNEWRRGLELLRQSLPNNHDEPATFVCQRCGREVSTKRKSSQGDICRDCIEAELRERSRQIFNINLQGGMM